MNSKTPKRYMLTWIGSFVIALLFTVAGMFARKGVPDAGKRV